MEANEIYPILAELNFPYTVTAITQFCREEDGSPYDVWKIETDSVMDDSVCDQIRSLIRGDKMLVISGKAVYHA